MAGGSLPSAATLLINTFATTASLLFLQRRGKQENVTGEERAIRSSSYVGQELHEAVAVYCGTTYYLARGRWLYLRQEITLGRF